MQSQRRTRSIMHDVVDGDEKRTTPTKRSSARKVPSSSQSHKSPRDGSTPTKQRRSTRTAALTATIRMQELAEVSPLRATTKEQCEFKTPTVPNRRTRRRLTNAAEFGIGSECSDIFIRCESIDKVSENLPPLRRAASSMSTHEGASSARDRRRSALDLSNNKQSSRSTAQRRKLSLAKVCRTEHEEEIRGKERISKVRGSQEMVVKKNNDSDTSAVDISALKISNQGFSASNELIGRDAELSELHDRIKDAVVNCRPMSIYLSGMPGTGKTACVKYTLRELKSHGIHARQIYLNCMSMRTPQTLLKAVALSLTNSSDATRPQELKALLTSEKRESDGMIIMVLDEVDQLESKSQEVLYTAFGWPSLPDSRVILIGIANSLDLTERLLPKLKLQHCVQPNLMKFTPYNQQTVIEILTKRMQEADVAFDTKAIELCARKVASITGDLRKALDLCKLAIEHHRFGTKQLKAEEKKVTADECNETSEEKENVVPSTPTRRVGIREVISSVNDVYGNREKTASAALPLHAQLLVAAACALVDENLGEACVALDKLLAKYTKACEIVKVPPLSRMSVLDEAMISLNDHGLMTLAARERLGSSTLSSPLTPRKSNKKVTIGGTQKVRLLMDTASARRALTDLQITASVLSSL